MSSVYDEIDPEKTRLISVAISDTLLREDPNPGEALVGLARVVALTIAYHLPEDGWDSAALAFGELVRDYLQQPFMKEFAEHAKKEEPKDE